MAKEIERKFLVLGDHWRDLAIGVRYRQGYLLREKTGKTIRIRIVGDQGFLTIKSETTGFTRLEFEYPIPLADAMEMLEKLGDRPQIEKQRYRIPMGDFVWEVDEFFGENAGLIVAEIELNDEAQSFPKPEWIGLEVTRESRYFNASLVDYPYSQWTAAEQHPQ